MGIFRLFLPDSYFTKILNFSVKVENISACRIFRNHLKLIDDLMINFNATNFYVGSPLERLQCLNLAAEYIQNIKDTQTRFMGLTRRMKIAYNIVFP